jgi:hypothetical protein
MRLFPPDSETASNILFDESLRETERAVPISFCSRKFALVL